MRVEKRSTVVSMMPREVEEKEHERAVLVAVACEVERMSLVARVKDRVVEETVPWEVEAKVPAAVRGA